MILFHLVISKTFLKSKLQNLPLLKQTISIYCVASLESLTGFETKKMENISYTFYRT